MDVKLPEKTPVRKGLVQEKELPQPMSKIQRFFLFFYECIYKEFTSCLRHIWYRIVFLVNISTHRLNPVSIQKRRYSSQIAKVVLLIHGSGAHPSSFIPMAEALYEANIENVFTVALEQSEKDPVPVASLQLSIKAITERYLKKGYRGVEFAIIAHSLGAIVASKYVWNEMIKVERSAVSIIISIGGRLKYVPNQFSWFCKDVTPDIKRTFKAIVKAPNKVKLFTIWGDQDAIVPMQSVHIQGDKEKEYTVEGWGHGGIVFAPETHEKVIVWVQDWLMF